MEKLRAEFLYAIENQILKKAVFSKPEDKSEIKTVLTPFINKGELCVKKETFLKDGKAIQKILSADEAEAFVLESSTAAYRQINLVGESKTFECLVSSKGKPHYSGTLIGGEKTAIKLSQNKEKRYIITPSEDADFLSALGLLGKNGEIHDKKQAKFRQINKFLEQIEAVEDALPKEGTLHICDLCCGKSYLTFAVYRYFTAKKGRDVEMYGVDLKQDVIEYCAETAKRLGYSGMHFTCGDVSKFTPPETPDMVLSLHACDVATDYVLAGAIRNKAKVILSTPCCQHEFNSTMKCDTLGFITEHSMLKQKLAAAATDALRAKMLEIYGYSVTVCELIDPEETPKNLIIRGIRGSRRRDVPRLCSEYAEACQLLGVEPTLLKLLGLPNGWDKTVGK